IADQFFFHLVQRYAVSGQLEPDITKRLHRLGDRVRHIGQGQAVFVRQHHHSLNKVFELADIPGEAVVRQDGDNIPADRKIFKSVLFLRSQKEVMKQKRDVLAASAKRRQVDGYDRETEIKIFAERPIFHHLFEILIRCGDDSDVNFSLITLSYPNNFLFLQDAKQIRLQRRRHLTYLVQEHCPAASRFKLAFGVSGCARKASAFVSE